MPKTEELKGRVTLDLTRQPELPTDYQTFSQVAAQLQVVDEYSYQIAARMIQQEVRWGQVVDAFFNDGREQANKLHKWFTSTISKLKTGYSVRGTLEPRMIAYKREQEHRRRQEEQRILREQELAQARAREEAAAIQRKAEAEAAALRKEGDIRKAREAEALAAEQAQAITEQAQQIADVGVILPAPAKVEGLSESRPLIGVIYDPLAVIKAVAAGKIPLMHGLPERGGGQEMVPIITVNQAVITYLAKRLGKEEIGIPGCRGERSFQMRVSKSAAAPEKDGW